MADLFKFDLRLLERHMRHGVINDRDYQAFLRELPDMEGNFEEVSIEDLVPKNVITKLMGGEPKDAKE
jgi:hypothetical protein